MGMSLQGFVGFFAGQNAAPHSRGVLENELDALVEKLLANPRTLERHVLLAEALVLATAKSAEPVHTNALRLLVLLSPDAGSAFLTKFALVEVASDAEAGTP